LSPFRILPFFTIVKPVGKLILAALPFCNFAFALKNCLQRPQAPARSCRHI
jgi:hypothetical protein